MALTSDAASEVRSPWSFVLPSTVVAILSLQAERRAESGQPEQPVRGPFARARIIRTHGRGAARRLGRAHLVGSASRRAVGIPLQVAVLRAEWVPSHTPSLRSPAVVLQRAIDGSY